MLQMKEIVEVMSEVGQHRPIPYNERDLQYALMASFERKFPSDVMVPEFKPFRNKKSPATLPKQVSFDIWLPTRGSVVEMKYRTKKLSYSLDGYPFELSPQDAKDVGRHGFLKDIDRLERLCSTLREVKCGVAIMVTNDRLYWEVPSDDTWRQTTDAQFRIHEGVTVSGELALSPDTSSNIQKKYPPLSLRGAYEIHWRPYSHLNQQEHTQFRYAAVQVS